MVTICLNMIVKNESAIILRLLNSVIKIIHTYCICDTGSTDNTIELISSFFKQHNIKGKIITEKFQNFAYNRNFALKSCVNMADFILLLDADMVINIKNKTKFFNKLQKGHCYTILQGTDDFMYENIRIIPNEALLYTDTKYIGITHEYISISNNIHESKMNKRLKTSNEKSLGIKFNFFSNKSFFTNEGTPPESSIFCLK